RGLLAETSPDAVRHFQEALAHDPFHHRANGILTLLLTLLGQLEEARARVAFAELVFPDDPTFRVLHALIQAVEDDLPRPRAQLERARPQLGEQQLETARALVELT